MGNGNQPVLVIVVFLPVLRVDAVLQNHPVLLAVLLGGEGFGVWDCLFDVWSRVNPPAIPLTWTWLLKTITNKMCMRTFQYKQLHTVFLCGRAVITRLFPDGLDDGSFSF